MDSGIAIISFSGLQKLHAANPLDWVLLALPGVKHEQRKMILQQIRLLKVGVRVLPTADQLMRGTADASQLQEVDIADLPVSVQFGVSWGIGGSSDAR